MTDQPPSTPPPASPPVPGRTLPRIGPDHRDLYLIIFGIVAGVLAGPGVLGRIDRTTYEELFIGGLAEQSDVGKWTNALDTYDAETEQHLQSPVMQEVTPEAKDEYKFGRVRGKADMMVALRNAESERDDARDEHRQAIHGYQAALLLTVLVLMVLETFLDPHATGRPRSIRNRLAAGRYAAFALWLALVIATPHTLRTIPLPFLGLAIVVALAAALAPLPARATPPAS